MRIIEFVNKELQDLESASKDFRDEVNKPKHQMSLMKNVDAWNRICVSMDVIDDSVMAIHDYLYLLNSKQSEMRSAYLIIYGIMQAIYMQQEALRGMAIALSLTFSLPETLKIIREIRNSLGHPVRELNGKLRSFHFISRPETSLTFVTVLTNKSGSYSNNCEQFNIPELLLKHTRVVKEEILKFVEIVISREIEHKKMFKDRKLSNIIEESLGYSSSKVWESLEEKHLPKEFAKIYLVDLKKNLEMLKAELQKRDIVDDDSSILRKLNDLNYPINCILKFINNEMPEWTKRDSLIYYDYIYGNLRKLKTLCVELDEYYEGL